MCGRCEFHVNHEGGNTVVLRSAHSFGGVGFFENGAPKAPFEVGEGLSPCTRALG